MTFLKVVYTSGYQLGVREKYVGVRQIFNNLRFALWKCHKNPFTTHLRVREFSEDQNMSDIIYRRLKGLYIKIVLLFFDL